MPIAKESVIGASDELMMRQIHPNMTQEGRPWSGAFTPTSADDGLLSADRSSAIGPKEAYERYLKAKGLAEAGGTWGVSVTEFSALGLICYADPVAGNAEHALVDFSVKPSSTHKALGKVAYAKAIDRGRLYPI